MPASRGAYRVAIQQRTAARRALEWIGASKARLVFRYEMSDLFCMYVCMFTMEAAHTCPDTVIHVLVYNYVQER